MKSVHASKLIPGILFPVIYIHEVPGTIVYITGRENVFSVADMPTKYMSGAVVSRAVQPGGDYASVRLTATRV